VNAASSTLSQVNFVNKAFWRNPSRAFFTFAFPLMFLVIFTALLGNSTVHIGHQTITTSTYYVSAMAAFGLITACYSNIAMTMTFQRETGILKRVHGTPLPSAAFLGARVIHALLVGVLLVALTAGFGALFYDVTIPSGLSLVRFLVMLVVGAMAFCALGLAVSGFVPNADAAPAVVNATILPLLFLSGIFVPFGNSTPDWIIWIARIFPVRHFAAGMQAGFLGTTFDWTDVLVVALWGVGGLLVAVRWFRWEPRAA
jgi:ABC-2 type transport system permease protein